MAKMNKIALSAVVGLLLVGVIQSFQVPSNNLQIPRVSPLQATTVEPTSEKPQSVTDTLPYKIFDAMMNVPLFHDILFGVYRSQSVEKAEKMGIAWKQTLKELDDADAELKQMQTDLTDPKLTIPDYYYAPIHAYADGNLCWDSAKEEDLWSKLMIAPLFNGRTDGDVKMRQNWIDNVDAVFKENKPRKVMDQGCGTGLSMYMCQQQWPEADFLGVDMSTYKLAISEQKRRTLGALGDKVTLKHAPAEASGEAADQFDLVSICLVNHESPLWVSKALFAEAYRTLKPGGLYTVLDLDKENLEILLTSPFVAAIYKQTEPYVQDFLALDMPEALEECGFEVVRVVQASKSHKAIVARKPLDA
ncbi:unnamed protein product [Heterosigma akashiwo]